MRTIPYSQVLANVCALIGIPTSRLNTEEAATINALLNANTRKIWGLGNWQDVCPYGEARFCGDLLTYPNDLTQTAYWTALRATATANSIANPADNRVTASKLMETATTGTHLVGQTATCFPSTQYQFSVYARPNGRSYIYLEADDGTTHFSSYFNVQAGTVGTQANVDNANITQCPNGFFLCTITYTSGTAATSQTARAYISSADSVNSYAGDITKGLYLWGALLVQTTNVSPQQFILPYNQTGESEIDVLMKAWVDNPAMVTFPRQQGFITVRDGWQMVSSAGGFMGTNGYVTYNTNPANPIYIYYRTAPYKYQGDVYSSTATYVAGQYIYFTYTTGASTGASDYYKCLAATTAGQSPETNPTLWELQPMPESLNQMFVWQTYADWLVQDGQADKAGQALSILETKKQDEWDRIERQMPNTFQMNVYTHVTSENRAW